MEVGYLRVSGPDQRSDRQLDGLALDRVFEDRQSGKDALRPQLQACLEFVREGDTLHVHSIDRLARSLGDLLAILDRLLARRVAVVFHRENLRFSGRREAALDTLIMQILGAVAQFERAQIRERQREGIAKARAQGRPLGRPRALDAETRQKILAERQAGAAAADLAQRYGLSRSTVYRLVKGEAGQ